MKCPACHANNPGESSFCNKCGAKLPHESASLPTAAAAQPAVVRELSTGSIFADRYEIIEELGRGGMGRVYKVFDKKVKEKVALKLIRPDIACDPGAVERFSQELKLARGIAHKSVCRMFDLGEHGGTHYITMEYVRGEDLKSIIHMMGRLSPGQAVSIARQVCEGLSEAHRLGIIHRDLKPCNIMIDPDGNAKIMDFGLARCLQTRGITDPGAIMGTPEYMSPEQVDGQQADKRSDIYALGIVLYEMLTGRLPFEGDTPLSVALKHKTEPPQDPSKINPQITADLSSLILRCLEKRQEKRYQGADEVLSEIGRIEKGIPVTERILPKTDRSSSNKLIQVFKRKWRLIAVVAVLAILAAIGTLYVTREQPTAPSAKKKLAVLPFDNIGLPEDEYFADGITDEIIARIAGVSELSVIARNSAIQYKKTTKSLKQIGQELGVDYVLSGTIRWQKAPGSAGRVRITPTLVKVSDATPMWAEVYDRPITSVFEVQSDISTRVVEALGAALRGTEQKGLEAEPTQNPEAYDYYLRANEYFYRGRDTENTLRLAIDNYEKAANVDPHFLQAYARLAEAQVGYYWYHFDHTAERILKAKGAVDRAMQIDPDDPETQIALGIYFYQCQMDYDTALNHFALAQKKRPGDSFALEYVAYVKRRQGKMNETVDNLKKAAEIDPQSNTIAFNLGETYALLRDYHEAEKWYTRALFLRPDYSRAYSWKTRLYLNQGDTNRARQTLEEASKSLGAVDPNLIDYLWVLTDIFENKLEDAQKRLAAFSSEAFSDEMYFVPKGQLSGQVYGLLKQSQAEKSNYESAVKRLEGKIKEDPQDSRYHSALGIALAGLGRRQDAIRAALKATEILPISKEAYRGALRATDLARVYTMAGEYDKAFDQIEYLLSIPGEISLGLLRVEPTWAPLRSLPRFQKLPNLR